GTTVRKRKRWDRYAPCVTELGRGGAWVISGVSHEWIDHQYRLMADDGRTIYVSEPYRIDSRDLEELRRLESEGWDVWMEGGGEHQPRTLRILLCRRGATRRCNGTAVPRGRE